MLLVYYQHVFGAYTIKKNQHSVSISPLFFQSLLLNSFFGEISFHVAKYPSDWLKKQWTLQVPLLYKH